MCLYQGCSAFVWALLWSGDEAEQGITSAWVPGRQQACGLTPRMLNAHSSTTAGASYCFRNCRDFALNMPFASCLMARKCLQNENTCAVGFGRFIQLSLQKISYFLSWVKKPPFFKLYCKALCRRKMPWKASADALGSKEARPFSAHSIWRK